MTSAAQRRTLRLHPGDNVLVALVNLPRGERVFTGEGELVLASDVAAKHKFASREIPLDASVVMYGVKVGRATKAIPAGEVLTTLNVHHETERVTERKSRYRWTLPDVSKWRGRTFGGFHRADGQVGTRNHWLVVPLVFCENRNIGVLKDAFEQELGFAPPAVYEQQVADLARLYASGQTEKVAAYVAEAPKRDAQRSRIFPNVDGIQFLLHEGGCGGTREDSDALCGLIAGYIHHPNVAGATILSLGCQNAQVSVLRKEIEKRDPNLTKPVLIFEQQKSGEEFAMLSAAIRETFLGLIEANTSQRKSAPLSALSVGLKCGGSDGFSGISANPTVGRVSDMIVALGGKTILSEFPELCGVEQELVDRSVSDEVAARFLRLMTDYSNRAKAARSGFDMNPSPGNIRDGLITDAMKSAGAAKKGGTAPIAGVLDYTEYLAEPGLHLQCTPGSDVECVTAQVGAGANVVLFTTGLGTPTGNPVAPVVKIATNSELAARMADIIDMDTGSIVAGEKTIEAMADEMLEKIIEIASGEVKTAAETLGQNDFIPWKRGVSL